jgi:anti-anti-sigma factor
MELAVQDKEDYKIIRIIGKVDRLKDSITLKSLLITLIEEGENKIALDLSQVNYLDSGALNVIIYCNNTLQKQKGKFCLIEPNEYVIDVLEVVGLTKIISIYSTESDFEQAVFG